MFFLKSNKILRAQLDEALENYNSLRAAYARLLHEKCDALGSVDFPGHTEHATYKLAVTNVWLAAQNDDLCARLAQLKQNRGKNGKFVKRQEP